MDYREEIGIPKREVRRWNALMEHCDGYPEGLPEYENVAVWTARFKDGCFADVKVNTSSYEDPDVWSEAVLFSPEGCQLAFTEPSCSLDGTWTLECGGDTYVVEVKAA